MRGLCATVIREGETSTEKYSAHILAVGTDAGIEAKILIPVEIGEFDLFGMDEEGFSEGLGLMSEGGLTRTMAVDFRGVDTGDPDGKAFPKNRGQCRKCERARVDVVTAVKQDNFRWLQFSLTAPLRREEFFAKRSSASRECHHYIWSLSRTA